MDSPVAVATCLCALRETEGMNSNGGKPGRAKSQISLDQVSQLLHLPITAAASALGVCVALLKRKCRVLGLSRWPYRQVKALSTKLLLHEGKAGAGRHLPSAVLKEIDMLKRMRETVLSHIPQTSIDDLIYRFTPPEAKTSLSALAGAVPQQAIPWGAVVQFPNAPFPAAAAPFFGAVDQAPMYAHYLAAQDQLVTPQPQSMQQPSVAAQQQPLQQQAHAHPQQQQQQPLLSGAPLPMLPMQSADRLAMLASGAQYAQLFGQQQQQLQQQQQQQQQQQHQQQQQQMQQQQQLLQQYTQLMLQQPQLLALQQSQLLQMPQQQQPQQPQQPQQRPAYAMPLPSLTRSFASLALPFVPAAVSVAGSRLARLRPTTTTTVSPASEQAPQQQQQQQPTAQPFVVARLPFLTAELRHDCPCGRFSRVQ